MPNVNSWDKLTEMLIKTLLIIGCIIEATYGSQHYGYKCEVDTEPGKCVRLPSAENPDLISLETCKLTCGTYGALFPRPQQATLGNQVAYFIPSQLTLTGRTCLENVCPLIEEAFGIFQNSILTYHPNNGPDAVWGNPGNTVSVTIDVSSVETQLKLDTDESYKLLVSTTGTDTAVTISAQTFYGARHALETLSQLINYEEETNTLQILQSAEISDSPAYAYRGLIMDTSRNFLPVSALKRNIDAMSYNKLNRFHWHITDSQSFPLELPSQKNFSEYGAYSQRETYSAADVQDIVAYAKVRGIMVLPEFDAPAHAAHGWEWGPKAGLGNLAVCIDKQPWLDFCAGPPCGQLNIANPNIYSQLAVIYKDMLEMFGTIDMFHYGGDEIYISCWNSTQEIVDWMVANNHGLDEDAYHKQWSVFQDKAYQLLTEANNNVEIPGVIWTSSLTEPGRVSQYLDPSKYIIQIWSTKDDPVVAELLQNGYNVIFSNHDALYLDCGFSSWVADGLNWCSPYKSWQTIYDNDIMAIVTAIPGLTRAANGKQVLGGEAAIWTEQVDANNLDSKVWPRASAMAERLWTNPTTKFNLAVGRMLEQRRRLTQRGVQAERLQPEWCRMNDDACPVAPVHT